jgi:hypothetical protein
MHKKHYLLSYINLILYGDVHETLTHFQQQMKHNPLLKCVFLAVDTFCFQTKPIEYHCTNIGFILASATCFDQHQALS